MYLKPANKRFTELMYSFGLALPVETYVFFELSDPFERIFHARGNTEHRGQINANL